MDLCRGILAEIENGKLRCGDSAVCTLTGHGLKDPDTAIAQSDQPVSVAAKSDAVRDVILAGMP